AIGAPLLSGGRGGLGVVFGPTGGYIFSFPIVAFLIGFFTEKILHQLKLWKMALIQIVLAYLSLMFVGLHIYLSLLKRRGLPLLHLHLYFCLVISLRRLLQASLPSN